MGQVVGSVEESVEIELLGEVPHGDMVVQGEQQNGGVTAVRRQVGEHDRLALAQPGDGSKRGRESGRSGPDCRGAERAVGGGSYGLGEVGKRGVQARVHGPRGCDADGKTGERADSAFHGALQWRAIGGQEVGGEEGVVCFYGVVPHRTLKVKSEVPKSRGARRGASPYPSTTTK